MLKERGADERQQQRVNSVVADEDSSRVAALFSANSHGTCVTFAL